MVLPSPPPCTLRITLFQRIKGQRVALGYAPTHYHTNHHHLVPSHPHSSAAVEVPPMALHTPCAPTTAQLDLQGTTSVSTITVQLGPASPLPFAAVVWERLLGLGDAHHTGFIHLPAFVELMEVWWSARGGCACVFMVVERCSTVDCMLATSTIPYRYRGKKRGSRNIIINTHKQSQTCVSAFQPTLLKYRT